jgi:hypothetical protein
MRRPETAGRRPAIGQRVPMSRPPARRIGRCVATVQGVMERPPRPCVSANGSQAIIRRLGQTAVLVQVTGRQAIDRPGGLPRVVENGVADSGEAG